MSLESSVTYIDDLNSAWPEIDDPRAQGDDHIRNIKKALKNSFPVDLRNITSISAGQVIIGNTSGGLEIKSSGITEITDNAITLTDAVWGNFSGNTQNEDDLGLWAAGNPTRFTAPDNAMNLIFTIEIPFSGRTDTGYDSLILATKLNGGARVNKNHAAIIGSSGSITMPFFWHADNGDYLEIDLQFNEIDSGDASLSVSGAKVYVMRWF